MVLTALAFAGVNAPVQAQGIRELEYRARERDDPQAMRKLGLIHYHGLHGYKRSYKYAVGWWEKAVREGDAESMLLLGNCYRLGKGVPRSESRAFRLFKDAAEEDKSKQKEAMQKIRLLHLSETLSWWEDRVEDHKDKDAAYFLATVSKELRGSSLSDDEADRYMVIAASLGHKKAQQMLRNEPLSRYLRQREKFAREHGTSGLVKLAKELLDTENCTQEARDAAHKYYREAAANGNKEAKDWLQREEHQVRDELIAALSGNQFSRSVELLKKFRKQGDDEVSVLLIQVLGQRRLERRMVQLLLDNGAQADLRNSDGLTPLMAAIKGRQSSDVIRLFTQDKNVLNASMRYSGETALMLAAEAGNMELVEELVRCGANVYATDSENKTAADYASTSEIRDFLGNKRDEARGAAEDEILNKSSSEQYDYLLTLIAHQDVTTLKRLLDKGMSARLRHVGFREEFQGIVSGRLPAQEMASLFAENIIKARRDAGFSPKRWLTFNSSLLMAAAEVGNAEIFRLLIDKGADVNAVDNFGMSVLMVAMVNENKQAVKILLEKGADKSLDTPIYINLCALMTETVLNGSAADIKELYGNVELIMNPTGETATARDYVLELPEDDEIRKLIQPYLDKSGAPRTETPLVGAEPSEPAAPAQTPQYGSSEAEELTEPMFYLSRKERETAELVCYIAGGILTLLGIILLARSQDRRKINKYMKNVPGERLHH